MGLANGMNVLTYTAVYAIQPISSRCINHCSPAAAAAAAFVSDLYLLILSNA